MTIMITIVIMSILILVMITMLTTNGINIDAPVPDYGLDERAFTDTFTNTYL